MKGVVFYNGGEVNKRVQQRRTKMKVCEAGKKAEVLTGSILGWWWGGGGCQGREKYEVTSRTWLPLSSACTHLHP